MAISEGRIAELYAAFEDSAPKVILAGAAISSVAPSSLPDASAWVEGLLRRLVERSALNFTPDVLVLTSVDTGTGRLALPLEAVLSTVDSVLPGEGTAIVDALSGGVPTNVLHREIAWVVTNGPAQVVTTNFDTLIEDAYRAAAPDARAMPRWSVGDPFDSSARLFKPHGTVDIPSSLRHTFRMINRGFSAPVREGLRALTSERLIVLGYAGGDFDVAEVLASTPSGARGTSGDTVFWLEIPGRGTPKLAELMSASRQVVMVEGTFTDLARYGAWQDYALYVPDGYRIWPAIDKIVHRLDRDAVQAIVSDLLYRARCAEPPSAPLFDEWRSEMRNVPGPEARRLVHQMEAAELQHRGGFVGNLVRSAGHALVGARPTQLWRAASDAMDAVQRIGHGSFLPGRLIAIPIHLKASRDADEIIAPLLRFRFATALSVLSMHRTIVRILTELIEGEVLDTYLEGLALKRRALSSAALGRVGWLDDLDRARVRFEFENRTVELGVLVRVGSQCALLEHDPDGALQRLVEAESLHREHAQWGHLREVKMLAFLIRHFPSVARMVIWFS